MCNLVRPLCISAMTIFLHRPCCDEKNLNSVLSQIDLDAFDKRPCLGHTQKTHVNIYTYFSYTLQTAAWNIWNIWNISPIEWDGLLIFFSPRIGVFCAAVDFSRLEGWFFPPQVFFPPRPCRFFLAPDVFLFSELGGLFFCLKTVFFTASERFFMPPKVVFLLGGFRHGRILSVPINMSERAEALLFLNGGRSSACTAG